MAFPPISPTGWPQAGRAAPGGHPNGWAVPRFESRSRVAHRLRKKAFFDRIMRSRRAAGAAKASA